MKKAIRKVSTEAEDMERLRKAIKIDKDALDECIVQQPMLFLEVSENYTRAISERDRAKDDLEQVESETSLAIRSRASKLGEKITVDEINSRVSLEPDVLAATEYYLEASASANQWLTLREAFMQRGYMLRELAGLYASGYWGNAAIKSSDAKEVVASRTREVVKNYLRNKKEGRK